MRIRDTFPWEKHPKDLETMYQWFRSFTAELATVINGALGFGDGVDADNVGGEWATIADTGIISADVVIPHSLGAVPAGFILMIPPASGFITRSPTAWTSSNIYLRCSAPNQSLKIFILSPRVVPG